MMNSESTASELTSTVDDVNLTKFFMSKMYSFEKSEYEAIISQIKKMAGSFPCTGGKLSFVPCAAVCGDTLFYEIEYSKNGENAMPIIVDIFGITMDDYLDAVSRNDFVLRG